MGGTEKHKAIQDRTKRGETWFVYLPYPCTNLTAYKVWGIKPSKRRHNVAYLWIPDTRAQSSQSVTTVQAVGRHLVLNRGLVLYKRQARMLTTLNRDYYIGKFTNTTVRFNSMAIMFILPWF